MVIDRAAGQVDQLDAGRRDPGLARLIGAANDRVGVGDVEVAPDKRDAERRLQAGEESGAQLGHAVAIGVAQQDDVHAGLGVAMAVRLDELHHDVLGPMDRLGRTVGLHDEDIPVGQGVE